MRKISLMVAPTLVALAAGTTAVAPSVAAAGTAFSNTPLIATTPIPGITTAPNADSSGDSEPAVAFSQDGRMAVDGLGWLSPQVNLWTGTFGSTPSYFGAMDTDLQNHGAGRTTFGDGDADVEFTSSGTLLLADLDIVVNHAFNNAQLGVNVTRCPAGSTSPDDCTHVFLDTAGADRPWITTAGQDAWVAYHDSKNSALIRVKQSTDDGRTWRNVGSPIVGQGQATGEATFNNDIGPIVADPATGLLYEAYIAGQQQTKAHSANHNNIYVSHSSDGGRHWTAVLVFHAPPLTQLANFFPALAVDRVTHAVYTAWTDLHGVQVASSPQGGQDWSEPTTVSDIETTVMPWVAARNGKVDVVYYGTTASSPGDHAAVWNAYDSQWTGSWSVKKVSNTPNRVGAVCLEGAACVNNTDRELLDLFEVAEDPITGKAVVVYTDSTIDTWAGSDGVTHELPEIVVAFEN